MVISIPTCKSQKDSEILQKDSGLALAESAVYRTNVSTWNYYKNITITINIQVGVPGKGISRNKS